ACVILLAPFVPHVAEEMWQRLGKKGSIFRLAWPAYDRQAILSEQVLIVVQINGKMRAKITVPHGLEEEKLKELILEDQQVTKWIGDKQIKKFLIVQNRIASLVI
ncbi:MAG: class I tRNA ligase family protein, partial [Candidatus Omnitrophica bacterium]|nr:class I tRNA ligase family protein [Candidatus Omnitrophota bacterium]